ncbi:MAG: aldo/keto reductase, partial [Planctomycetota bacterium]
MNHGTLGLSGLKVSEICLGAMNFGQPQFGVGEDESLRVIAAYLDADGNFIDTADAYTGGESERIVAKAIKGKRERIVVATKGHFPRTATFGEPPEHVNAVGSSRRHLTIALEDSLRRLQTDYVDLYQVHMWDDVTPLEETLSTLDDFVHQGKVRYVGLSNFSAWQIAESRMLAKMHGW